MTDPTEDDIAAARDDAVRGISELRDRLQPDALARSGLQAASGAVLPLASRAGSGLLASVRAHPLGYGLAGAGLALILFGGWKKDKQRQSEPEDSSLAGTRFEAMTRWEDEGGPVSPEESVPDPTLDDGWIAEAEGLRDRAAALIARIDQAARDRLAPAAELARHRADVAAAHARDLRNAMERGLEHLAEQARDHAIATREAVWAAHTATRAKAGGAIRENPFIAGGLFAAAGAAIAAALPRSELEAKALGGLRDTLFDATRGAVMAELVRAGLMMGDQTEEDPAATKDPARE